MGKLQLCLVPETWEGFEAYEEKGIRRKEKAYAARPKDHTWPHKGIYNYTKIGEGGESNPAPRPPRVPTPLASKSS